jgi:hypothetical protein
MQGSGQDRMHVVFSMPLNRKVIGPFRSLKSEGLHVHVVINRAVSDLDRIWQLTPKSRPSAYRQPRRRLLWRVCTWCVSSHDLLFPRDHNDLRPYWFV